MKKLLILLMLISPNVHAWGNWAPEPYDKVLHVGVSAGLVVIGYKACKEFTALSKTTCRVASGITTFAITGPGKEWTDQNWDNQDMAASGAGTTVGIGITFIF